MIIQKLSSGETKYTKIETIFNCFNYSLVRVRYRYKSQSKWHTKYRIVNPVK